MSMVTIDGSGLVLGRAASVIASRLLHGETVNLVNAETIVVSGNAETTYGKYKARLELKDRAKPEKSPKFPKRPDLFVKRAVRGMLPWGTKRGRDAYRRLRVYMGVPAELRNEKLEAMPSALKRLACRHATISEICTHIGWRE